MLRTRPLILALVLLAALPASASAATGTVVRVVDGDTLKVRLDDRARTVDLLGVDAPDAGACHGADATRALERLAPRGARVRVKRDRAAHGAGRYVYRGARFVNLAMLADGHASAAGADRLKQGARLLGAEQAARAAGKGLWKDCAPAGGGAPPPPGATGGEDAREKARSVLAGLMFIRITSTSQFNSTEARLHLCQDGHAIYDISTISDYTGEFVSRVEGSWEVLDAQYTATSGTARVRFFNQDGELVRTFFTQGSAVWIDGVQQTDVARSDLCAVPPA